MFYQQGFSLIELVSAMSIAGLVSASAISSLDLEKLENTTQTVKHQYIAETFFTAVNNTQLMYRLQNQRQGMKNLVLDTLTGDNVSVNQFGYPVGVNKNNLQLENVNDCDALWKAILKTNIKSVPQSNHIDINDQTIQYTSQYISPEQCKYTAIDKSAFTFTYDAIKGQVNY